MSLFPHSERHRACWFRAPLPALIFLSALVSAPTHAAFELNLQAPVSDVARRIYELHSQILWICLGIVAVVFVPMAIALIRHRKSSGRAPAKFHDNLPLEILWTIVPVLILVGMAWPTTRLIVEMKDVEKEDLTIKATGRQWKWEYDYLGDDIRFISSSTTPQAQIAGSEVKGENYLLEVDRPLVIPVGKKVRLITTSSDVIHSWWVPAFGVKQDAIPGFIRETWFNAEKVGTYRGQCAELCGVGHGFMPVVVEVVTPEQFALWRDTQKANHLAATQQATKTFGLDELRNAGEKVYATNCAICHQPNGMGLPGAFPALNGSPVVRGDKLKHIETVVRGRPGTAMAAFGPQLSDFEIAAVITFERNHWSNQTGEAIQPAEVAARRGKP